MSQQNVILQALGPHPTVEVVQTWQPLLRDDYLLLCSDGLSGLVSDEEIAEAVARTSDSSKTCKHLVDLANSRGGPDNITVVLARFTGDNLLTSEQAPAGGGPL